MRNILLLCSILLATQVHSQTITSASGAEECIRYIDSTFRSILTQDGDYTQQKISVSFKGSSFTETQEFSDGSSVYTLDNIDWSTFEYISQNPGKNNTHLVFSFKKRFPAYHRDLSEKREQISLRINDDDYFGLLIKNQDTLKVKELRTAATRLSQIAISKTSRLLTVAPPKIPAEGKPTYKETVSYIKSFFTDNSKTKYGSMFTDWYDKGYLTTLSYKMLYLDVYESTMYIGYETFQKNHITKVESRKTNNYTLKLDQITNISVRSWGIKAAESDIKNQTFVNYLVFKTTGSSGEIILPFDVISPDASNNGTQTQIFKAFTHLKKLCGAPEPVVFE